MINTEMFISTRDVDIPTRSLGRSQYANLSGRELLPFETKIQARKNRIQP